MKKWFSGIRFKFAILILISFIFTSFLSIFMSYNLVQQKNNAETIAKEKFPKVILVNHIRVDANAVLRFLWTALTFDEISIKNEKMNQAGQKVSDLKEQLDRMKKFTLSEKMSENIKKIENDFNVVQEEFINVKKLSLKNTPENLKEQKQITLNKIVPKVNAIVDLVKISEELLMDQVQQEIEYAEKITSNSIIYGVIFSVIGIMLSLIIGIKLSIHTLNKINEVIFNVNNVFNNVNDSSISLNGTSQNLSSTASELAASLHETVVAVDEITAMVNKNAENATQSKIVSNETSSIADYSKNNIEKMVQDIQNIQNDNNQFQIKSAENNKKMTEIINIISEINNKTKIINNIVFQTKLLSFNASVEAARAGEHGRGFSVVAEEIGNLAQMSGNSSKEIEELLLNSTSQITKILQESKEDVEYFVLKSKGSVEEGIKSSHKCRDSLNEIVEKINKLNLMVSDIHIASDEQAKGVTEISIAMQNFDKVAQNTNKIANVSLMDANKLKDQADVMAMAIKDLTVLIEGENSLIKENSVI
ncbi:methyl-accepting chemotaxis protein [Silvanigrella sp.]|jgi:methyl-accepting chemotaxis protein|uniref:methyl-accepting chemotaxis protein n=1 Tax=Silvanigrella sp. TaxID=2024976 RepID=UPI0037C8BDB6